MYNWLPLNHQPQLNHWRDLAEYWHVSDVTKQKLEWLIFDYSRSAECDQNRRLFRDFH